MTFCILARRCGERIHAGNFPRHWLVRSEAVRDGSGTYQEAIPRIATTPARLLMSVMANASYPNAAARFTSSSGCEAPVKNEKFVLQRSST